MIALSHLKNRTIGVFGLGASGLASVAALVASGARVLAWDDGELNRPRASRLGAVTVRANADNWSDIEMLVLSPGVALHHPAPHPVVSMARDLGVPVIGDVELFAAAKPAGKLVTVSGTNGKSTTTALIDHLLRRAGRASQCGGNIGTPILDLRAMAADGFSVLELSSYQLELTESLAADVAVLLNVGRDHLDRHGGIDGYRAAKRRLIDLTRPEATLVLGVEDSWCRELADELAAAGRRIVRIAGEARLDDGIFGTDGVLYASEAGDSRPLASLNGIDSLRGRHNAQNAAAAFAATRALGLDDSAIAAGLPSFAGLPHRLEIVQRIGNAVFINDSKATNAESTAHALACYSEVHWIVGGRAKSGGIGTLAPLFPNVAKAYLIGEAAADFAATMNGYVRHEIAGDLETATRAAFRDAGEGRLQRTILLSPACASFDQFANFEARGDTFRAIVRALAEAFEAASNGPAKLAGAR